MQAVIGLLTFVIPMHVCFQKQKNRLASAPLNRETKSCDDIFGVLFQLKAPILCNLVSVIYLQLNTRHCVQM